jgi:hypothetical protein
MYNETNIRCNACTNWWSVIRGLEDQEGKVINLPVVLQTAPRAEQGAWCHPSGHRSSCWSAAAACANRTTKGGHYERNVRSRGIPVFMARGHEVDLLRGRDVGIREEFNEKIWGVWCATRGFSMKFSSLCSLFGPSQGAYNLTQLWCTTGTLFGKT